MSIVVALVGDTMLGRGVGDAISEGQPIIAPPVAEELRAADLAVANLECCISDRGEPWPNPEKPFFFRAPPAAAVLLKEAGIDCVNLANNHALDYCEVALIDTLGHLDAAGIRHVGAGPESRSASAAVVIDLGGPLVAVLGITDHPREYAAGLTTPGVAFADLRSGCLPGWVQKKISAARESCDAVLVSVHWGPNMVAAPVPHVRATAPLLLNAGATLIAGHSAHVFHGAQVPVLWDLGDFVDDYAVDPSLRNDLSLLWLVTLDGAHVTAVEALPLKLDYCYTRIAQDEDRVWVRRRLELACAPLGWGVSQRGDRLRIEPR
jgi:capsule synthesis protein PGA_cap